MGQQYTYSTRWEKNIVAIIHIYGATDIFLLFYDHQDIGSKPHEIEMSIYQPIFNHKKISKYPWDNGIHNLQYGRKILWEFFIFIEIDPFLYYFVLSKTPSLSKEKRKLVFLNQ